MNIDYEKLERKMLLWHLYGGVGESPNKKPIDPSILRANVRKAHSIPESILTTFIPSRVAEKVNKETK